MRTFKADRKIFFWGHTANSDKSITKALDLPILDLAGMFLLLTSCLLLCQLLIHEWPSPSGTNLETPLMGTASLNPPHPRTSGCKDCWFYILPSPPCTCLTIICLPLLHYARSPFSVVYPQQTGSKLRSGVFYTRCNVLRTWNIIEVL